MHGCTVYTECAMTGGSEGGTMDLWVHGGNRPSRLKILSSFLFQLKVSSSETWHFTSQLWPCESIGSHCVIAVFVSLVLCL